jgi:hypothetical protein
VLVQVFGTFLQQCVIDPRFGVTAGRHGSEERKDFIARTVSSGALRFGQ